MVTSGNVGAGAMVHRRIGRTLLPLACGDPLCPFGRIRKWRIDVRALELSQYFHSSVRMATSPCRCTMRADFGLRADSSLRSGGCAAALNFARQLPNALSWMPCALAYSVDSSHCASKPRDYARQNASP